jgi:peptidoglycan/LPS O-acetylase OafA/YrhL
MNTSTPHTGFADSKRHYPILDGLRGVAALVVVAFHLCEAHGPDRFRQLINHGYLAVDFFFLLSGFVIGYAYDDRWRGMTIGGFFKRRLIRLHPMIVAGMAIGACFYYFQGGQLFPIIDQTPPWKMLLVMAVGMTLIPLPPSLDIRGWGEMHALDAPAWSLFFEYVANILYALVVRRFSRGLLAVLVFVSGAFLVHYLVSGPNGDVIGGWSLDPVQFKIGLTRLMYPFFGGLLLSRVVRPGRVRHAFPLCAAILVAALAMPRFGGPATLWMNGLYEAACILFVFPLVVWLGASGAAGAATVRACNALGGLSYPLYIVHYPLIYTYTAWVVAHKVSLRDGLPVAAGVYVASVAMAWLLLKYYDEPVRRRLTRRYMDTAAAPQAAPALHG